MVGPAAAPHRANEQSAGLAPPVAVSNGSAAGDASIGRGTALSGPVLPWRQTYGARQVSQHFLTQYGWAELVGLTGPVPSRTCAVGFLLLGPGVEYPPHHHEALELYLPLAGRAAWWRAQSGWQQIEPGEPVLHARWEAHAMRTESEPLLALYLWRSEHLDQHAELTDRRALEG